MQVAIFSCAGVDKKLFLRDIYCANTRPNPGSQSGSWSHRVLRRRYLQIMRKYDLETAIAIRTLNQPRTCERVYSSFVAMSRLNFISTTIASFLRILSTKRTNGEFFLFLVVVLILLIFILILPMSQQLIHCFLLVGVCIRVSKYGINYGVSLNLQ